ncbi:hypothetical protein HYN69_11210 [Gemmobacter aquarius]|uniref:PPM-type phosphatase domain-containing protein n=1 Tax=Paragemmobacter aquarius TaxID=2169400 RepID=A0A2S0UMH2_9RHOB|nr:PP2C family protein-serine/threonine phosphatase [Gemmobacter aquarius]AWB48993.1 hypothetical protein HYN69_11210 [Gemmobacter aquarius]
MTHRRTRTGPVWLLCLTALAMAGLPVHAAVRDESSPAPTRYARQKDAPTIRAAQTPPVLRCPLLRDTPAGAQGADRIEARPAGPGAPAPGRDTSRTALGFATLRSTTTAPRIATAANAGWQSRRLPSAGGPHPLWPAAPLLPAAYTAQGADAATFADRRDTLSAPVATTHPQTPLIPLGALLLLAASLALALQRALSRRALAPLGEIRTRLAKLVAEDFSAHEPANTTRGDIADMHCALDQLSLDGRRRLAMQAELARLGDRVVASNRQMTAELEAAARVQRAQLPAAPCGFQGGTFHAFFRPSRVIAGDTYDCLPLPDGRSRIFQIDVSGHGAPAALVSIASHIALKQAMLSAPAGEALADIIARINRDWAEDLPYFTLLAVEIDPATATASIVQCGHPALLRLPATGGVEALGDGGLPIGVLPDASFSTLTCPFHPGDRLVLVTDGVTETADPDAQMFGDDRLRALLTPAPNGTAQPVPVPRLFDRIERALWDWRGSESLEDDITILVLEAT